MALSPTSSRLGGVPAVFASTSAGVIPVSITGVTGSNLLLNVSSPGS